MSNVARGIALVLLTAAISVGASWFLLTRRMDRQQAEIDEVNGSHAGSGSLLAEVLDLTLLLQKQTDTINTMKAALDDARVQIFALRVFAHRDPANWWCHAGKSKCFRDRATCAAKHAQGDLGCEPRPVAFCRTNGDCFGDEEVCATADAPTASRQPIACHKDDSSAGP